LLVEPRAQLSEHRRAVLDATTEALFGRLAEQGREALDGEDATEDAQRHEGERVAGARGGNEATAPVGPAAGALAARTLRGR